jgi:GT2 family glycosyltransferase
MTDPAGVTFVVPVHNGARWLDEVLNAIAAQADGRPFEVIAVDDRSTDESRVILERHAAARTIRIVDGPGRGAAAAINAGVREASHPIICQVDQDVILRPGWMSSLTRAVAAPDIAAAQGYYLTPRDASIWARVMGLDLEQRYGRIRRSFVDHVCTGNSVYRADALRRVGLFDESLGYGYDNDMSYRLAAAGYRLAFCPEARSLHRWRESIGAYLTQQYGVGYGRLDVVAKHRRRASGDDVSGLVMILHAPAMLAAVGGLGAAALLRVAGGPWRPVAVAGGALLATLGIERLVAGVRASLRFRDAAALGFLPSHLLRDAMWALALVVWSGRRVLGPGSRPSDSMRRGKAVGAAGDRDAAR